MTTSVAHELDDQGAFTQIGSVQSAHEGDFSVTTAQGTLHCRRAHACLVEPEPGDLVLVAGAANGSCWVLSILEREATAPSKVTLDGDVDLDVKTGRLRVAARDGVELLSPKEVLIAAGQLALRSKRMRAAFEELSCLGSSVVSELGRVKASATSVDSVVGRLTQRVKLSFRKVEEIDQVDAKCMDYKARETFALRSENAVVAATKVVKVDGEQILMG